MSIQIALTSKPFQPSSYLPIGKDSHQILKKLQTFSGHGEIGSRQLDNASSLEERLYDARALCKIKTSEVAMYLSDEWRKGFFSQLDNLMDIENWEEDDIPVTGASFTTLLRMLTHIKPKRRPGLGSTSGGNIIAAWTNDKNRLTIECLPGDRVRWVLSHMIDGVRESGAGEVQLIRLQAVLAPYNPNRWFINGA